MSHNSSEPDHNFNLHLFRVLGLVILLVVFVVGCGERTYLYPTLRKNEFQRICSLVVQRRTLRFSVINGHVFPLVPGGGLAPIEELMTSLRDGSYHCGNAGTKDLACSPGKTGRLGGEMCSFSR